MSQTVVTLSGPAEIDLAAPQLTHNRPRARSTRPPIQFPLRRPHKSLKLALLYAAALMAAETTGPAFL
jgi:hypothetical protein